MGSKMGSARKLEPPADDASASGLRDALYSSTTDSADSPTLDEQAVLDILESAPYAPPDQMISDGRDDTDTSVQDSDSTVIIRRIDFANWLERKLEAETGIEHIDSDTLQATSQMKVYVFGKTSWTQRVLSWFRND